MNRKLDDSKVRTLVEAGWSDGAIAREFGCTARAISHARRRLNLQPNFRSRSTKKTIDWKEVSRMRKAGIPMRNIAAQFGLSKDRLRARKQLEAPRLARSALDRGHIDYSQDPAYWTKSIRLAVLMKRDTF